MIPRYSRPQMADLWSERAKYQSWAQVERAHLATLVESKEAPAAVLSSFEKALNQKSEQDFLRREKETGHDVIAFIAELGDCMGDDGSYLHRGLTSSDVLDTSLALRVKDSLNILRQSVSEVRVALTERAFQFADTLCIGRTHGIHAEPLSFGQVLASHFAEFQRAHGDLIEAEKGISYGKLSGAVGHYSQLSPQFEQRVLQKLGLDAETVATQVVPRDRLVRVATAATTTACAVERFATNLRHWARTELGEVLEPFSEKQKGSSAMPHKKNPILGENLCGLARTIRGYADMLTENVALWHERDISHSSVERIVLPDLFVTLDFMLSRLADVVRDMKVRPEVMQKNLDKTGGLWCSQTVLTALVEYGMNRTKAYELVQRICLPLSEQVAFGTLKADSLFDGLSAEKSVKDILGESKLRDLFRKDRFLSSVPTVFQRCFGITPEAYAKINRKDVRATVPALQAVYKVTVELLPDVLDTEAKTVEHDFKAKEPRLIQLRKQKSFLVRLPLGSSVDNVRAYASEVLVNPVMEQFKVEVIQ